MNKTISIKDILDNNSILSPAMLNNKNNNYNFIKFVPLKDLVENSTKGEEIGSKSYIEKSNYFFIRTRAIQPNSLLLVEDNESIIPMHPHAYKKQNLKEGNILIVKDANVGETAILEKDLNNCMISGGIYNIKLKNYKYYVLAYTKTPHYKKQIDSLIPKGATIKHGKDIVFDFLIPFPNFKDDKLNKNIINFVEMLTKLLVEKEKIIKEKFSKISLKIEEELYKNQNPNNTFKYSFPNLQTLLKEKRLDTKLYSKGFKEIDYLIKNYKFGYSFIEESKIKIGNTPSSRVFHENAKYRWITPTNISDYGTIINNERIDFSNQFNLKNDAMLIINRTSKGGTGEYVGISTFYDYNLYGDGHHNQGIYRVENYSKEELLFMICFMNSGIIRKYCSHIAMGSKMKEIKSKHFCQIPIPKFSDNVKKEIVKLYYNETKNNFEDTIITKFNNMSDFLEILNESNTEEVLDNYCKKEIECSYEVGIFQLNNSIIQIKELIEKIFTIILTSKFSLGI